MVGPVLQLAKVALRVRRSTTGTISAFPDLEDLSLSLRQLLRAVALLSLLVALAALVSTPSSRPRVSSTLVLRSTTTT